MSFGSFLYCFIIYPFFRLQFYEDFYYCPNFCITKGAIVEKFSVLFCKIHIFSILKINHQRKVFRKENVIFLSAVFFVAYSLQKYFRYYILGDNVEKKCLVLSVLLCNLKLNRHLCIIIEL